MSQSSKTQLTQRQKDSINVLAKAVGDPAFLKELREKPKEVLNREGLTGDEFHIPDDDCIITLTCILNCLGDVWEKRS